MIISNTASAAALDGRLRILIALVIVNASYTIASQTSHQWSHTLALAAEKCNVLNHLGHLAPARRCNEPPTAFPTGRLAEAITMRRLETPEYQFALSEEPRLRELFERAAREPRGSPDVHVRALRDGVCSFVRRARSEGRHVETVIIALKAIMGVPDRPNRVFREEEDTPPNVLLVRRVVRWCITEYYGAGDDVRLTDG
jgi:hypothetical protein